MSGYGFRQKGILIVVVVSVVLLAIDIGSTLYLGDLVPFLEANILYKYIGLTGIALVNLAIIGCVAFLYWRSRSIVFRYTWMNILVSVMVVRMIVIVNNIKVCMNPPSMEVAMAISDEVKRQAVSHFSLLAYLPFLIGIMTFIFYSIDHKIDRK